MNHGHRLIARLAIYTALLCLPMPVSAWNAAGHRLGAIIAWQHLDENTREEVSRLLGQHPDYERWIAHRKGLAPELAAFVEASTWPDTIKSDKRFHDAHEGQSTPLLPGFPDMERHRHWHYVDLPIGHAPKQHSSKGELDLQLERLSQLVANRKAHVQQRAYALPWLIHLVADAHQPLHAVSRYDAEGRGDEGGNLLIISHPFHPRLQSMRLHTYWDDLAGPPWLRGENLERAAAAISTAYPAPPQAGGTKRWIEESWQLARDAAYPAGDETPPILTADFHERAQAIARKRVAESGYRLAALLRKLLSQKN